MEPLLRVAQVDEELNRKICRLYEK